MATLLGIASSAGPAQAEIYTYKNAKGVTIYTDRLEQLPPERRRYYNDLAKQKAEARARLEKRIGKEELKRREAAASQEQAQRSRAQRSEAERRNAEIRRGAREGKNQLSQYAEKKAWWQRRVSDARAKVKRLEAEHAKVKKAHDAIAIKATYTLLPGELEKREAYAKSMKRLEGELKAAQADLAGIPEEARKAGALPGWIR